MKLWIDDKRIPPDSEWLWAKSSSEATELIEKYDVEEIDHISYDHDLGGVDSTRPIALMMLGLAQGGAIALPHWTVHSANPVGVEWLTQTLLRADEYARKNAVKTYLKASYRNGTI